jgi:hypothetical protein
MEGVMDRLQPYQAAILAGSTRKRFFTADQADCKYQSIHWKHMAKMARESLDAWAGKKLPTWKHIGELGEIAHMEDGSIRWKVWAASEDMRLFLVYLASGEVETHYAYIDDTGMLCNEHGDDVGWAWHDAEYFMDIPERPSLPNSKLNHQ